MCSGTQAVGKCTSSAVISPDPCIVIAFRFQRAEVTLEPEETVQFFVSERYRPEVMQDRCDAADLCKAFNLEGRHPQPVFEKDKQARVAVEERNKGKNRRTGESQSFNQDRSNLIPADFNLGGPTHQNRGIHLSSGGYHWAITLISENSGLVVIPKLLMVEVLNCPCQFCLRPHARGLDASALKALP